MSPRASPDARPRGSSAVQGELWSADPPAWAERAECRLRPLYEAALERIQLTTGMTVLDAGCGAGLLAALAAERGARVSALDAAPGLIEYACGRVPAAAFVVGDLEDLPFPDRTFDVVTAFNSVLYASDPARAIAEIARVTGARGRVVLTMGTGSASATCAAMIDPLLPPDVEASSRTTLNLQDPDRTREVLARVGLLVLEQREIAFVTTFADLDDAVRTQLPAGPVEAAVRHSGRDAVVAALCSFFAPGTAADGTVLMPSAYRFVLAERARP